MRKVRKVIVLAILLLLIVGRSSAMLENLKEPVKHNGYFAGVAGLALGAGGVGLIFLVKWFKQSRVSKKVSCLKPGQIAVSEKEVRRRLGLSAKNKLPEDVFCALDIYQKRNSAIKYFQKLNQNADLLIKIKKIFGDEGEFVYKELNSETIMDYLREKNRKLNHYKNLCELQTNQTILGQLIKKEERVVKNCFTEKQ